MANLRLQNQYVHSKIIFKQMSVFFSEQQHPSDFRNLSNDNLQYCQHSDIMNGKIEHQQDQQNQRSTVVPKTHQISKKEHKSSSNSSKKGKKNKERPSTVTGRPPNDEIQKCHLRESKDYNDIFYHYSRMLIFLKLRNPQISSTLSLTLTNQESKLMSQTQEIMRSQNFPQYNQRTVIFLLHPNSLHFVFSQHKKDKKKQHYYSEQVKFMFIAVLKKKKLLCQQILNYINQYWEDIIYLVNHPQGPAQTEIQIIQRNQSGQRDSNGLQNEIVHTVQSQRNISASSQLSEGKKEKGKSELMMLKEQLSSDDSILAYEIACYLHACSLKYWFRISDAS